MVFGQRAFKFPSGTNQHYKTWKEEAVNSSDETKLVERFGLERIADSAANPQTARHTSPVTWSIFIQSRSGRTQLS